MFGVHRSSSLLLRPCVRAAVRAARSSSRSRFGRLPHPLPAAPSLRFTSSTASTSADVTIDEDKKVEMVTGEKESQQFQAETKQLLDIVAHSLYTDKEVFLRELISNASDALEKRRYLQQQNNFQTSSSASSSDDLEISVETNAEASTITITDTGVGMTREELISNLGTIARSGSKAFLASLKESSTAANDGIIGQFGVGFYSAFMVADRVDVFTSTDESGHGSFWSSDGSGSFEIASADNVARGSKIVMYLKPSEKRFAKASELERLVKKHSSFVGFPVKINGEIAESVGALWLKSKSEITDAQHEAFYKHIAHAYDAPLHHLHFSADAPIAISALFYVPKRHQEKYGLGKEQPGVHLYSRKVLIQPNNKHILPEWLRFVKGVVDSADIPLNISRESMQDSALVRKLNQVLSKRLIRFMKTLSKDDPKAYDSFFAEFGSFLKEGICTDAANKDAIAPLLRFESSVSEKPISLDEYISRMPSTQKEIYYMSIPSRALAEVSPYLDAFKAQGSEVLYLYREVDEFVMQNLRNFEKRPLRNVQDGDIEMMKSAAADEQTKKDGDDDTAETDEIPAFFESVLGNKVAHVKASTRLMSAPAMVVDSESAMVRKMMRMVEGGAANAETAITNQKMEINVRHPIIAGLAAVRRADEQLASQLVEQVYDNALVSAGILDDPRTMLTRVNSLMERVVSLQSKQSLDAVVEEEQEEVAAVGDDEAIETAHTAVEVDAHDAAVPKHTATVEPTSSV